MCLISVVLMLFPSLVLSLASDVSIALSYIICKYFFAFCVSFFARCKEFCYTDFGERKRGKHDLERQDCIS